MVDDFGGTDSDQGVYGPVGPETGSPGPNPNQGPPGPPGPNIDRYAATRIVSADPDQGTDLTIQDAINNLPAEGGEIFVKNSQALSATIDWPDKDITIYLAAGVALDWGTFVGPFFRTPNVLTDFRQFMVWGPGEIKGGSVAGQILYENAQASGFSDFQIWHARIYGITQIFKPSTAAGVIFTPDRFSLNYLSCYPPGVDAGGDKLANGGTPGNFALSSQTFLLNHVILQDQDNPTRGWNIQYDSDIIFQNVYVLPIKGACASNGFSTDSVLHVVGVTGNLTDSVEYFGYGNEGHDDKQFFLSSVLLIHGGLGASVYVAAENGSKLHVNCSNSLITWHNNGFGAARDYDIKVLVGADDCVIQGSVGNATVAQIDNAALRTRVIGVRFNASGGAKTFQDSGAGDYAIAVGCTGLSTGGGIGTLGANSKVAVTGPAGQDNLA